MPRQKVVGERVRFEWEQLDDLYLPVIFRGGRKFLPVRIVELKLLTRFTKVIPEELQALRKCVSYYITEKEALLLDELNLCRCKGEYGLESFNTNDVVVEFHEFRKFFDLINDTVISRTALEMGFTEGGWLQINNTVCPYVWIGNIRHVPFEIVSLAAELVDHDDSMANTKVTESQLKFFNGLCTKNNRSFSFGENTELVSLLSLKMNADPVIIELPADNPFEHATYIDLTLDRRGITQIKARAKQAMNAYYNAAIVKKFQKDDGDTKHTIEGANDGDESSSDIEIIIEGANDGDESSSDIIEIKSDIQLMVTTPTSQLVGLGNSSTSNTADDHDFTPPRLSSPSSETLSEKLDLDTFNTLSTQKSHSEDNLIEIASAQYAAQSVQSYQMSNKSSLHCIALNSVPAVPIGLPEKVMTPPDRTANSDSSRWKSLKVYGNKKKSIPIPPPPDPMENRMAKELTMQEKYRIESLNSKHRFCTSTELVLQKIAEDDAQLKAFCKAIPMQFAMDKAVIQMISKCINIFSKVKIIFNTALGILKKQMAEGSDKPLTEAIAVVTDAVSNFSFWNASAHKVTMEGATIINQSLLGAIMGNHICSLSRSPDIVQYVAGGVFGARTLTAAANFRFIQEVMCIGFFAMGASDHSPLSAYNIAQAKFEQLTTTVHNWCCYIDALPKTLAIHRFPTLIYDLYDKVYLPQIPISPTTEQVDVLPLPPPYSNVASTICSTASPHVPITSYQMPVALSRPQVPQTYQAYQLPIHLSNASQMYPQPLSSLSTASQQYPTSSHPPVSQNQLPCTLSLQSTLSINTPPILPAFAVNTPPMLHMDMNTPSIPSTLGINPSSILPTLAGDSPAQNSVTSRPNFVKSKNMKTIPVLLPKATSSLASQSKVNSAPSQRPTLMDNQVDCAETISLSRFNGKKIPTFSAGAGSISWVLVEDVHKTYYPRTAAEDFLQQLSSCLRGITMPISNCVGNAYRLHYGMSEDEQFEIDMMMTFYSLSTVISKIPPKTSNPTKRPAVDNQFGMLKKKCI